MPSKGGGYERPTVRQLQPLKKPAPLGVGIVPISLVHVLSVRIQRGLLMGKEAREMDVMRHWPTCPAWDCGKKLIYSQTTREMHLISCIQRLNLLLKGH